jgi:hypothetical protein
LNSNLEKLPAEMLARVAEHGHAQVMVDPQQQVGEHPPGKNVREGGIMTLQRNGGFCKRYVTKTGHASLKGVFLDRARGWIVLFLNLDVHTE